MLYDCGFVLYVDVVKFVLFMFEYVVVLVDVWLGEFDYEMLVVDGSGEFFCEVEVDYDDLLWFFYIFGIIGYFKVGMFLYG